MELDSLTEISRDATLEASKALSKLVHAPVSLGTLRVEVKKDIGLFLEAKSSDPVYLISGSIVGDAAGLATLGLPLATARGLCDLLFERQLGTTQTISLEEEDALLELGNIVVGNYLRAFSRAMPGTTLVHRSAKLTCDECANVAQHLTAASQSAHSHDALLFEVTFNFRHSALTGCVVVALEAGSVQNLFEHASTA